MKAFFTKYIKPYIPLIIVVSIIFIYNFSNRNNKNNNNIEGLDSNLSDMAVSFCKKFEGKTSELEGACERLTSKNCKTSNCCVFVNGNKCSAGDASGPTYKTDANGKPIAIDNYYYQNKCYGNGCPK